MLNKLPANILLFVALVFSSSSQAAQLSESPDTNWSTGFGESFVEGFGEYGNGEEYLILANVDPTQPPLPPTPPPLISDPSITSPAPSGELAGYTDTFEWVSNGTEVSRYWVYVGSTPGGNEYGNSGSLEASTLSYSPTALPLDGSTVYVTLFWFIDGAEDWLDNQYTYTAATGDGPSFTTPLSGATLANENKTFEWTDNGSGATQYWLYLGSAAGNQDYHSSGLLGNVIGDNSVSFLPADGSTIHARLWYRADSPNPRFANRWLFIDDTFTAASSGGPAITSPVPGSAISGTSITLSWEAGAVNIAEWWVYVGTEAGASDIYNSQSLGSALSDTVTMPANGSVAHVTLWYLVNGKWRSTNYVYESESGSS